MQTTIFLRTEMSRKTEYVHNPCFLSANILKILGVFAENQNYQLVISNYQIISQRIMKLEKSEKIEQLLPHLSLDKRLLHGL